MERRDLLKEFSHKHDLVECQTAFPIDRLSISRHWVFCLLIALLGLILHCKRLYLTVLSVKSPS